jgi:hypothetical protein
VKKVRRITIRRHQVEIDVVDLRDELELAKRALEQSLDLNDEFYDVLKKWGIQEPVLERYRILKEGGTLSNFLSPATPTEMFGMPSG